MTDPTGTTTPHTGLVVEPYRDHGAPRWVFRCWGTDTCDGLLSLDHDTRGSAESARDRHVAEEHAEGEDDAPHPGESLVPRVLLDHIERHDADAPAETNDGRHRCPHCGHATTGQALSGGREWYCPGCGAVEEYPAAPPAGALRDTIAEAVHATSVCEVGDPARCGGGCRDAADAVLATPELAQRLAHLADYENRITWETNCGEHARLLDSCYAETVRAEKAEAGRAEAEAQAELTRGELVNTLRELAELRRVSALHADTERQLRADLAAEVRKREAAEAAVRRVEDTLTTLQADADRYDATGQTELLHTAWQSPYGPAARRRP